MSRTWKDSKNGARRDAPRRNLSVRAVRRERPDIHKLSRALLELAIAEMRAEQDAQDAKSARKAGKKPPEHGDA